MDPWLAAMDSATDESFAAQVEVFQAFIESLAGHWHCGGLVKSHSPSFFVCSKVVVPPTRRKKTTAGCISAVTFFKHALLPLLRLHSGASVAFVVGSDHMPKGLLDVHATLVVVSQLSCSLYDSLDEDIRPLPSALYLLRDFLGRRDLSRYIFPSPRPCFSSCLVVLAHILDKTLPSKQLRLAGVYDLVARRVLYSSSTSS